MQVAFYAYIKFKGNYFINYDLPLLWIEYTISILLIKPNTCKQKLLGASSLNGIYFNNIKSV